MNNLQFRPQQIGDGKRFFQILSSPNFTWFPAKPKSIKAEKVFLRLNREKWKKNFAYNFSILADGEVIGAVGIKIDQHRTFKGEVGYFVDEAWWGRGVGTSALQWIENYAFGELGLKRIEVLMDPENLASEKVAIKAGYQKEGLLRKAVIGVSGGLVDVWLYAKVAAD